MRPEDAAVKHLIAAFAHEGACAAHERWAPSAHERSTRSLSDTRRAANATDDAPLNPGASEAARKATEYAGEAEQASRALDEWEPADEEEDEPSEDAQALYHKDSAANHENAAGYHRKAAAAHQQEAK